MLTVTDATTKAARMPTDLPQLNIRLDPDTRNMLHALQDRYGLSQAAVIKMLIRDRVTELKIKEGFTGKRKLGGR